MVIAIVGILATSTMVVFKRFNQQQNITIAAKDMRTALAEAKANAASNVVRNCTSSVGSLRGYRLFQASATTYSLQEICLPNGTSTETFTNVRAAKSLPSGVSFSPSFTQIRFNVLTGASSGGSVSITSGGTPIVISVSAQGVIQ